MNEMGAKLKVMKQTDEAQEALFCASAGTVNAIIYCVSVENTGAASNKVETNSLDTIHTLLGVRR